MASVISTKGIRIFVNRTVISGRMIINRLYIWRNVKIILMNFAQSNLPWSDNLVLNQQVRETVKSNHNKNNVKKQMFMIHNPTRMIVILIKNYCASNVWMKTW